MILGIPNWSVIPESCHGSNSSVFGFSVWWVYDVYSKRAHCDSPMDVPIDQWKKLASKAWRDGYFWTPTVTATLVSSFRKCPETWCPINLVIFAEIFTNMIGWSLDQPCKKMSLIYKVNDHVNWIQGYWSLIPKNSQRSVAWSISAWGPVGVNTSQLGSSSSNIAQECHSYIPSGNLT